MRRYGWPCSTLCSCCSFTISIRTLVKGNYTSDLEKRVDLQDLKDRPITVCSSLNRTTHDSNHQYKLKGRCIAFIDILLFSRIHHVADPNSLPVYHYTFSPLILTLLLNFTVILWGSGCAAFTIYQLSCSLSSNTFEQLLNQEVALRRIFQKD
jgi:hypothetical protein